MNRRVLACAAALSVSLSCSRGAPEQAAKPPEPAPPPPPPAASAVQPTPTPACTPFTTPQIDVRIAQDATASPDCVVFEKKVNKKIVWTVDPPATGLSITWKAACPGGVATGNPPLPPACSGTACTLDVKNLTPIVKRTELCYAVEVSFQGKPPVTKDPKLIVNP